MMFTNKFNLPKILVTAITRDDYSGNGQDTISVTRLIDSPRVVALTQRHSGELVEDITDNAWRLLGQSVHSVIEKAARGDSSLLTEVRYTDVIDGRTVTGQIDLYDKDEQTLFDVKVTSCWTVTFNPEGKREWINQTNCYAHLLRMHGHAVKKIIVIAILRDWQESKAGDESYPASPLVAIELPVWEGPQATAYMIAQVRNHQKTDGVSDDNLPLCTEEERWTKPTTYAVKKGQNIRAVRVLNSREEADAMSELLGKPHWVEVRPGSNPRCERFCSVNKWCSFYKANYIEPAFEEKK